MKPVAVPGRPPRVGILTPVYNEEESLPFYVKAVRERLFSHRQYDFRILFIEDGSRDRSWDVIEQLCREDPRFAGIRLSRNFGSHLALSAGFDRMEADALAVLACDLQDPPEVILKFLEQWQAGFQIVWGRRRTRQDIFWKVMTSNFFYRLIKRFAMPADSRFTTGSFLLVDRLVARAFRQFQERNRITFALVAWTGFRQAVVEYDRQRRLTGISGWNFGKMIKTMYDAFIGFSFVPVRIMTLCGMLAFLFAVVLAIYLLLTWYFESPAPGWTSQMLAVAFFFGIQFFLMGIAGEYLYRIYMEVTRRPLYFVSDQAGSLPPVDVDGDEGS
jgi:dolichol-phosphate mannosyltransferase